MASAARPVLCAVVMSLGAAQAVAQSTSAAPMTWTYEYDANANLTRVIDPLKAVTDRQLDSLQRIYRTTQPLPKPGASRPKIDQRYDALDQPSAVIDPRNLKTTYTTTGLGDTTDLSSPDSGADKLTHDDAGNIKTRRDARGKTTTYSYDALNRLTLADYPTGIDSQWEYDGGSDNPPPAFSQGRLTKLTDESGTTRYGYDGYGRVLSKRQTTTVGSLAFKVDYAWGASGAAVGKLQSLTYPSQARIELTYDDSTKRLSKIVVYPVNANGSGTSDKPVVLISQIGYNAWNALSNWRWGDGRSYSRSWDEFARPKAYPLGDPDGRGTAEGAQRKLDYDDAGRIIAYTHFNGGKPLTKLDQSFDYDGLGRLTQAVSTATVRNYGWDDSGNRSAQSSSGSNYVHSLNKASNRYDEVQVPASTGVAKRAPQYDDAGHLKASGSGGLPIAFTASYSDRGRMDSLTTATGKVSYRYNALEQRISKSGPAAAVPTGAAHYVYDEQGHVLGEYDAKGNPLYEVVWLNEQPLAVIRQSRSNDGGNLKVTTDVDYIYADHLDTPRLIVRSSGDHAIVWRWDSAEPFGNAPADDNPNKLGRYSFNLRLPGQLFDAESALHYNHHRDYDAYLGRYAQPDPIGLAGGINPYTYAENRPTFFIDPLGLAACPGGTWDQEFGDFAFQAAAGGFFQGANLNVKCRAKPALQCEAKQVCVGGGPMLGAGVSWALGGVLSGMGDSDGLSGWGGWNVAIGAGPIGGQMAADGGQSSIGPNVGWKFGAAAMRCYTYAVKCKDDCKTDSAAASSPGPSRPWTQSDFLYGRAP